MNALMYPLISSHVLDMTTYVIKFIEPLPSNAWLTKQINYIDGLDYFDKILLSLYGSYIGSRMIILFEALSLDSNMILEI